MKKIEKLSEREMRSEIRQLRGLLEVARCPNGDCIDGRIAHQISDDEWEAVQCQWCHERTMLLQGLE